MTRKYYLALMAVLAVFGAVGVMAVTGIDFVEGQKIPTTLSAAYTFSGANTHSGGPTFTNATATAASATINGQKLNILTAANGANTITAQHDVVYVGSGSAATLTLPTMTAALSGKKYTVIHNNGTTATTITAGGGFSINGAVSNTDLDAALDTGFLIGTGTAGAGGGWVIGMANH